MKIFVIADDQDIVCLNRLNHADFLSNPAWMDAKICLITEADICQELEKFQDQEIRLLNLKDLIRSSVISVPPKFSDIAEREESSINEKILHDFYRNKSIFVTGGEGFIGSEIVHYLLTLPVKKVIAYGHSENNASELANYYATDPRFTFVLGDIRDLDKLSYSMNHYKPDTIFHAAAHKHVPILEEYPEEAVKTNILGTRNTALAAVEAGVERFVFVSTDKAVNPTSALGASKRIAEKICLSMDTFVSQTRFTTVRFGNVFGSTGSVVPIFLEQIAVGSPLSITDENMLRYFMSVREAVGLVLLAGASDDGNLFSFDMGDPISIKNLAQRLLEYVGEEFSEDTVKIIGKRRGEKFSEELIHSFEKILQANHDKLLVLQDQSFIWTEKEIHIMCSEFSNAAYHGTKKEILDLFDRYISATQKSLEDL